MSDDLSVRLLKTIQYTLLHHVRSQLESSDSIINLDMSLRMLELLEARHDRRDNDLVKLLEQHKQILSDVRSVFDSQGDIAMLANIDAVLNDDVDVENSTIAELELHREAIETLITNVINALHEISQHTEHAKSATATYKSIVRSQQEFMMSQDRRCETEGIAAIYRGGRILDEDHQATGFEAPPIDQPKLTNYLQQKFPEKSGISAKDVKVIPGGFSKLTVFFTLCEKNQTDRELVIRKDMPVSAIDSTVVDEYELVCKVFAAGLPVAEPLWLEKDKTFFDGAFIVSKRAYGANDISGWQNDPAASDAFVRELAKLMADLHSLDVTTMDFPEHVTATSAGDHMLDEIEKYYRFYKTYADTSQPMMDLVFSWLRGNVPEYLFETPAKIVHADIGFHNMLTSEGKISAVLDWEMSHFGDPLEDLYYSKLFIDQVSDWSTFLEYYYSFGGVECGTEAEQFYSIWMGARNAVGCTPLPGFHKNVLPNEIKLAVAGYLFGTRLQVDVCNKIFN